MTDEAKNREDLSIEQAMSQVLATGAEPRLLPPGGADAARVRQYTEVLGLLPSGRE